ARVPVVSVCLGDGRRLHREANWLAEACGEPSFSDQREGKAAGDEGDERGCNRPCKGTPAAPWLWCDRRGRVGARLLEAEELRGDVARRLPPILRFLGKAALDDMLEGRRSHRLQVADRARVGADNLCDEAGPGLAVEGARARRHLVEDRTEGEDVGALIG